MITRSKARYNTIRFTRFFYSKLLTPKNISIPIYQFHIPFPFTVSISISIWHLTCLMAYSLLVSLQVSILGLTFQWYMGCWIALSNHIPHVLGHLSNGTLYLGSYTNDMLLCLVHWIVRLAVSQRDSCCNTGTILSSRFFDYMFVDLVSSWSTKHGSSVKLDLSSIELL